VEAHGLAVADSSPVIALETLGELRLLPALFADIVVPLAVWAELDGKPNAPEPRRLLALPRVRVELPRFEVPEAATTLDEGERQAIATALALRADFVLIDEKRGRAVAAGLGLDVRGTLAVLIEAKRRALIGEVRPLLTRPREAGFHLTPALVARVLAASGEPEQEGRGA